MWSRRARALVILVACGASVGAAWAHPKGTHKRDVLTLRGRKLQVLVTLDIDSGKRSRLLRTGADRDGDGALSSAERGALRARLASLARRPLKIEVSGYSVEWQTEETKIDLRGEPGVSDGGLSVAVLLTTTLPGEPTAGMALAFSDEAPDHSSIAVDVYLEEEAGRGRHWEQQLASGETLTVRLDQIR